MDKNVKENIKVIKSNDEEKDLIKELEDKIKSMKEDKEKKCKAAKEQLIEMLDVTVDKYRTATGTAEALRVMRFIIGDDSKIAVHIANDIAWAMAQEVDKMKQKANELPYAEMDKLCDGFYNKEYKMNPVTWDDEVVSLTFEMMRIDLCRNVGGAAEDMVEFIKRVEEEIDSVGEELKALKNKED